MSPGVRFTFGRARPLASNMRKPRAGDLEEVFLDVRNVPEAIVLPRSGRVHLLSLTLRYVDLLCVDC